MRCAQYILFASVCLALGTVVSTPSRAEDFGSLRRGTVARVPKATELRSSVDENRQWLKQQVMNVSDPIRRNQLVRQVEQMSAAQVNQVVAAYEQRSNVQSESKIEKARRQLREAQAYRDYLLRLQQQQLAGRAAPGFRPLITTLPSGVSMGASAVVSPDRRYVRIGVTAFQSSIGPVRTFNMKTGETRVISP
jgi:hypothetical protein